MARRATGTTTRTKRREHERSRRHFRAGLRRERRSPGCQRGRRRHCRRRCQLRGSAGSVIGEEPFRSAASHRPSSRRRPARRLPARWSSPVCRVLRSARCATARARRPWGPWRLGKPASRRDEGVKSIGKGSQSEEVGARGSMEPRAQCLERKRMPRVVAGDALRRSGSCARSNASARAGANLIDRSRNDSTRRPLRVRIIRTR